MNVVELHAHAAHKGRELVAGEVRAELARQRQTSNSLPKHVGKSQRYWYQRLNANISFSVDDLAVLADFLNVPMSKFMPATLPPADAKKAPTPKGEGLDRSHLSESNRRPIHYKWNDSGLPELLPRRHAPTRAHIAPVTPLHAAR